MDRLNSLLLNRFDAVGACAGEVRDPENTYPSSLAISVGLMMAIYVVPSLVGLSFAPFYVLWRDGSFINIAGAIGGWPLRVCFVEFRCVCLLLHPLIHFFTVSCRQS